ncbi:MAG: hypothetical protein H6607_06060 [Flavobacteriales bacterium]|nr:hypothetical protein [Flavobacteriales bacterium]
MIKIRTLLIMLKLLEHYQNLLRKGEAKNTVLNTGWVSLLSRKELILIIQLKHGKEMSERLPLTGSTNKDLLALVEDEYFILGYFLNVWQKETSLHKPKDLDDFLIYQVLHQLGQTNHYLNQKPISQWDDYDASNFNAKLKKAGWMRQVFGIYDALVQEHQVNEVNHHPIVLFDNEPDARLECSRLVSEEGFEPSSLKVLSKTIIIPPF